MAQEKTLHIKVEQQIADRLKDLARKCRQPVGELIRRAIVSCYQVDFLGLTDQQRRAVEAYRGGCISIGKLSEIMGKSVLALREWLNEQGLDQNVCLRRGRRSSCLNLQ